MNYRDPAFAASDKHTRAAYLNPDFEHDVPDDTAAFLRSVAPLGRFSVDLTTTPPTLYFENGYD